MSSIRDGGVPIDVDPHDPIVEALTEYSNVRLAPAPDTLARLRAELVRSYLAGRIERERPEGRARRRRGWAPLRWALALGTSLALLAGASVVAAAEAGPGQPLYHVRLTIETLTLPAQGAARVQALLSQLETRLSEARDAGKRGDHGAVTDAVSAYEDALGRLTDSAAAAGNDQSVLDELARHETILQGLLEQVPTQARQGLQHALDNAQHARDAIGRGSNGAGHGVGNPHNATQAPPAAP